MQRIVASVVLLACVVTSVFFVIESLSGNSQLHDDGVLFFTIPLNRGHGEGGFFSVYYTARELKGNWRYDVHGQLTPAVFACLGGAGTVGTYRFLVRLLTVATFAVSLPLAAGWFRAIRTNSLRWPLIVAASLLNAYVARYLQGRPEHLIPFWLAATELLVQRFPPKRWGILVSGVQVGVVAACSPVPGAIFGLYRAAVDVEACRGAVQNLAKMFALALVAIVCWWAVTWVASPYSPIEVVKNTVALGKGIQAPRGLSLIPRLWLFDVRLPLIGVVFAIAVMSEWTGLASEKVKRSAVLLKALVLSAAVLLAFRFSVYQLTNYNLIGLLPFAMSRCFSPAIPAEPKPQSRRWLVAALSSVLLIGLVAIPWRMNEYRRYLSSQATWEETKSLIDRTVGDLSQHERILIGQYDSLILFDQYPFRMISMQLIGARHAERLAEIEKEENLRASWFLLRQHEAKTPPDQYEGGFVLVDHNWNEDGAGFPVAIYRRR